MALGKKKIILSAGVSVTVLVTALAVGLGFGLTSSKTVDEGEIFIDAISGNKRSERDLLNNGITADGKTYHVVKENNKLFVVIAKNEKLELTQPQFNLNIIGEESDPETMGGADFKETLRTLPNTPSDLVNENIFNNLGGAIYYGEDYFYSMIYGNIGHVKIINDGYIWGGFKYNRESAQIEKHEALTNGPLKFGTVYSDGHALIDLAVVYEYQEGVKAYIDAITDTQRHNAAVRIRNADSINSKTARDAEILTWKILNQNNQAKVFTRYSSDSLVTMTVNPDVTGIADVVSNQQYLIDAAVADINKPDIDENGKFNITTLACGENNLHGYRAGILYHDDNTKACLIPNADENNLALVNQEVSIELGKLNYKLFNFQGGHIKNPLLNKISTTSELTATPDGYVTLPGITDRVRVQEKTNYVVVPSDIKIELDKAPSS